MPPYVGIGIDDLEGLRFAVKTGVKLSGGKVVVVTDRGVETAEATAWSSAIERRENSCRSECALYRSLGKEILSLVKLEAPTKMTNFELHEQKFAILSHSYIASALVVTLLAVEACIIEVTMRKCTLCRAKILSFS